MGAGWWDFFAESAVHYVSQQAADFIFRACKSRARKRGWGQLGAGNPYSPC